MKGNKFLSELVDTSSFSPAMLNIIKAPTGSGKTYFALKTIPSLVQENRHHKVVYLIDTRNGKQQIVDNYAEATIEDTDWFGDVCEKILHFEEVKVSDEIVVMTYAKFGMHCTEELNFSRRFKYIICDELPSLIRFQGFEKKPNCHSIALQELERVSVWKETIVVALTATPKQLEKFHAPKRLIPIDDTDLQQYETLETKYFYDIKSVLSDRTPSEIGICYREHIGNMLEIEAQAKELGLRPICIWSDGNPKHPMSEAQLAVRETILQDFRIPEEYNLLIINASSETSSKIKSPVDYVIVYHSNEDVQTQVRGRVNHDLKTLYLHTGDIHNADITIPDEYLGVKLFAEDKDKLCNALAVRTPNSSRLYRWTTISELIKEFGYVVSDDRDNNRRYSIITLAE